MKEERISAKNKNKSTQITKLKHKIHENKTKQKPSEFEQSQKFCTAFWDRVCGKPETRQKHQDHMFGNACWKPLSRSNVHLHTLGRPEQLAESPYLGMMKQM